VPENGTFDPKRTTYFTGAMRFPKQSVFLNVKTTQGFEGVLDTKCTCHIPFVFISCTKFEAFIVVKI